MAICLCLFNCNNSKINNNMIDFKVIITEYVSNASHDNYEDGSFSVFDAVNVKVMEPEKMKNQVLTIFINKEGGQDSIWQRKNCTVTFSIDGALLKDNVSIYKDALENIQVK